MAKGAYFGVGSTAKKIKKMYIGIGGIARKVKKAYIGIAGKARLWFSGGEPEYYGIISDFKVPRFNLSAASNRSYALFGGGLHVNSTGKTRYVGNVDAYNKDLTHQIASDFLNPASHNAGSSVGNYALFAGGINDEIRRVSEVNAYNSMLTRTNPESLKEGRTDLTSGFLSDYALIIGGNRKPTTGTDLTTMVDAYSASLSKTYAPSLNFARNNEAGVLGGRWNKAMVGGGSTSDNSLIENVEYYTDSLTHGNAPNLTQKKNHLVGAYTNKYALFCGGKGVHTSDSLNTVDAYDSSLTKIIASPLSEGRAFALSASGNGYALICYGANKSLISTVDIYDDSLTRTNKFSTKLTNNGGATTIINDHAIFSLYNRSRTEKSVEVINV